jgi:predicted dehydrogenase
MGDPDVFKRAVAMKALVVGAGSIGARHLRNLKNLGVAELALAEPDTGRRTAIASELQVTGFEDLDGGLAWSPDFAVIATPPHLHLEQATQVARKGVPLFVEKPVCHTSTGLAELSDLIERKRLASMVGCNLRFHPGPAQVKHLLGENRIGRVLSARVYCSSYLPEWRPQTDYRNNYAAREEFGGGCILDCIHEIDLTRWYLGDVQEVFCMADHISSLEIHTEDVAALTCRHASGAISEIHLDYIQRNYQRGCHIVGEHGTIDWDFNDGEVRWFEAHTKQWTASPQPPGWNVNQMYVDEMRHFIECLRDCTPTTLSISEALAVMQIAFAAKASARDGRVVIVGRAVLA